ncbi:hypothetical protein OnM2_027036 [Erysiphe neolycopersici]|uniref:Uncharacterized protein n=1 Tax=Erysiphe neolycopersici TaxID=212602 RepID=A0A420I0F4_9PEZI|nr:hypothetical protein OnM2_027036 [Erysiphe neolycopersici]
MASRASESQSPNSAQMSHPLCVSDENTICMEPKVSLSPVEESLSAIYPEAAYIAAPAASQIIANNIRTSEEGKKDKFLVDSISIAPSALALVNRFLDQLLFDTLSNSQTLAMPFLRPAIVEVLKPNFAVSAIKRADLELKEYLDGSEDCILSDMQDAIDLVVNVDVYTLWKQTRLRCMLYSSLGDMEDENGILSGTSIVAAEPMMISPAVAIFITSVLEFMGEQILAVAGRAAHRRLRSKNAYSSCGQNNISLSTGEYLTIEVLDVEYIAFDKLLGELWRAWKENKGLSAVFSSRPRKRSQASVRTLPSLRELQYKDEFNPQQKKDFPSSILKCLAHLDLASTNQTPKVFSNTSDIIISNTDTQIRSRIYEDTFKNISKPIRSKSYSLIELENHHLVPRAKKRRANSMPQSARSQSPRTFKRLKALSNTEDSHFQEVDNTFSTNESIPGILNSTTISKDNGLNRPTSTESDRIERALSDLGQNSCISEENSTRANSNAENNIFVHKTAKNIPSNKFGQKSENRNKIYDSENLSSSRSSSVDLRGRSYQNSDKFKILRKDSMVILRRTSFQGNPSVRYSNLKRPMSMSIPKSTDNNRYFGIEQSMFPSPPFSRTSKSRSSSIGALSEYQVDQVEDFKQTSDNCDIPIKRSSKLASGESKIEEDEQASPEIANFAVAVQGVDIYNLDTELIPYNIDDKKNNLQTTQPNLWHTKPIEFVRKRLSVHESDGNVSPISQLSDELKSDGRISPLSTISSLEKTPDQEIPSRSHHRHFTSTSEIPDYQLNLSAPLTSNPVTSPPKYHTHSINSRSSSRSHKAKIVFNPEENDLGKFDRLIKSDQTIQYTLTPETVRDVEVPDQHQRFNRKKSEQGSILVKKVSSSSSKYVTLDTSQTKPYLKNANSARTSESNSNSSSVKEVRLRSSAPQPRDARIERDKSLSDFAKFIRSTGPDISAQNNPKPFHDISYVENQEYTGHLDSHSNSRSLHHKRFDSTSIRIKFPRREIMSKRSDSFSSFIDFVRPGPKLELTLPSTSQDHASYNSPTLSNQSWAINENKNSDGLLAEPRQWQNSPSIDSSVTSQSALLVNSSQNKSSKIHSRKQFDDKSKIPARKVRKVRDPYSIDFLDEEDWSENSQESKPKESESLKEFLRNTSPTDILEDNVAGKTNKASPTTPSLMSLFGRRPSSPQSSSKGLLGSIVSHQSVAYSSGSKKPSNSRPVQLSSIVSRANVPRANFLHKNFEPREATSRVRTDDLAKFLMHNDPPSIKEKNNPLPLLLTKNFKNNIQVSHKNETGSFQRIFSRKRISTLSKS